MSRAWAKTKPGLFTQWRLQHRSHDSGQAVRLSIYTALGSAPRRELRMKTLDMVVGGRNGVRLQDIMYPVQVTWHAMQKAKAQRWTLHKIVDQANLCTGRKIWTFAFESVFSLQKNIASLNPKPAQDSRNAKGKKKIETTRSSMLENEILNPSPRKDFMIATHPNLVSTAAAPRVYPQRIPTEPA